MALHYDPIRIKRLAISSSCTEDIILFQDLHLIAQHISFSLASLSESPLRSCSFYEKGCCTLIPTICVGSVDTATLSIFCMPSEYPGCPGLHFPTIREYSPSPRNSGRQSLLTLPGSPAQHWIVVRYLDNMWHTIGDPDIQHVQRWSFIWLMSDGFMQRLKGELQCANHTLRLVKDTFWINDLTINNWHFKKKQILFNSRKNNNPEPVRFD